MGSIHTCRPHSLSRRPWSRQGHVCSPHRYPSSDSCDFHWRYHPEGDQSWQRHWSRGEGYLLSQHVSTRATLAPAVQVKAFSNAGKLVPDEIVTAMVKSRLAEPDAKYGFILDGYPRTIRQAEDLDSFAVRGVKSRASPVNSRPSRHSHSADDQRRSQHFTAGTRADGEDAGAPLLRRLWQGLQPRQHQRG